MHKVLFLNGVTWGLKVFCNAGIITKYHPLLTILFLSAWDKVFWLKARNLALKHVWRVVKVVEQEYPEYPQLIVRAECKSRVRAAVVSSQSSHRASKEKTKSNLSLVEATILQSGQNHEPRKTTFFTWMIIMAIGNVNNNHQDLFDLASEITTNDSRRSGFAFQRASNR